MSNWSRAVRTMSAKLYPMRILDPASQPIAGALLHAESPNGSWSGLTDACGWFMPTLADGTYALTVSASEFVTRSLDLNLANPPTDPILIGLERAVSPFPPAPTREEVCGVKIGF